MKQLDLLWTSLEAQAVSISKAEKPDKDWALKCFREVCEEGTSMVYLYGQNSHLCFARTHGTDDPGKDMPLTRKEAEDILKENHFILHCNHIGNDGKKALVYIKT